MSFKSFSVISYFEYVEQIKQQISKEIESKSKEYILGVTEQEYKDFLIEKFSLVPVIIDYNNESIREPVRAKKLLEDQLYREKYQVELYVFKVVLPYTGSKKIFEIAPSSRILTSGDITVTDSTVSYEFELYKMDADEYHRAKKEHQERAFGNLENANTNARALNNLIIDQVSNEFKKVKENFEKENNFFEAIKLNVSKGSVFVAPTVQKKIIPQPAIPKGKEFNSEPALAKELYEDILSVIYNAGKHMETKPALYENKGEEGLRDQFLYILETRYDNTTAVGEAFNRSGKTDIILKWAKDSTNLFVAECKIWHGATEFHSAISQLFDRYLTWRDSKTALMIFVKNKDFTNVLKVIKEEVKQHPYFIKEAGTRGDSSFSYIFRLNQDPNKHVFFEIMAFHYDK